MGSAQTRLYIGGQVVSDDVPVSQLAEHLARPGAVVWVDLATPGAEELTQIAEELGLHELAVEDALEPRQRPKLDRYATHLFLACHRVSVDLADGGLQATEVDAFIGDRWLVTVRQDSGALADDLRRMWDRSPELARHGVGFLVYGLLDMIVDEYFATVQIFDDYYDDVMEEIFAEHPMEPSAQREWFQARRALARFHRLVAPLREAVSSLMRSEHRLVSEAMHPYFQDIYDHVLRVGEATDSLRDLAGTVAEANLSLRDYRQNQIMKKVTSWAAIIAVPTLITGYFGMNVPYPGDGRPIGVVWSTALMVVTPITLYVLFRRRDWL